MTFTPSITHLILFTLVLLLVFSFLIWMIVDSRKATTAWEKECQIWVKRAQSRDEWWLGLVSALVQNKGDGLLYLLRKPVPTYMLHELLPVLFTTPQFIKQLEWEEVEHLLQNGKFLLEESVFDCIQTHLAERFAELSVLELRHLTEAFTPLFVEKLELVGNYKVETPEWNKYHAELIRLAIQSPGSAEQHRALYPHVQRNNRHFDIFPILEKRIQELSSEEEIKFPKKRSGVVIEC